MPLVRMLSRLTLSLAFSLALTAPLVAQSPAPAPPAAPAAQWQTYSYSADGFSAVFPAQPQVSKRDVPTAAGSFELRSYLVTQGNIALFVGVCDYGAAATGKDPDTLLQGAKNGALQNSNSHLVSESKLTLGANPGIAFESESTEMHFSARVYMVGTSLYQVLVVRPIAEPYDQTTRFLDSLQLIPRTPAQ